MAISTKQCINLKIEKCGGKGLGGEGEGEGREGEGCSITSHPHPLDGGKRSWG